MRNELRVARAAVLTAALLACQHRAERSPAARDQTKTAATKAQASQPPVTTVSTWVTERTDSSASAARPLAPILNVPHAKQAITPSSEFDVNIWGGAVNTHTLLDENGKGAVPVSEARFLWGHGQLYVAFYAGDLDLEMREKKHDGPVWRDDSLSLSFFVEGKKRMLVVSPLGVLADGVCPTDAVSLGDARCDLHWESHARYAVDCDGTINKLGDFDEEWNVQAAIPLASLGAKSVSGAELAFSVARCDMAFDGKRACGRWGTNEHPAKLILE